MKPDQPSTPETSYWLDKPRNVDRLFYGLVVVCALLLLADLLYHKHGHLDFENWFGFHGWYGFVVFTLVVLTGKQLRRFLMRPEDYYDR